MSDSPRTFSPWWILLLLPVALAIGLGIGRTPVKPAEPKTAALPSDASVSARVEPTLPRVVTRDERTAAPEPAPREVEMSKKDPRRGEISQWTDLQSAVAESQRNGKPVLIDFNADWCGPCQRMKQQLFEDATHGPAVQTAVIPVSIVDRAREEGRNPAEIESLQHRFEVDAFPTLVVFSPATGRAMKTQGFGDAQRTLDWIEEAVKAVR